VGTAVAAVVGMVVVTAGVLGVLVHPAASTRMQARPVRIRAVLSFMNILSSKISLNQLVLSLLSLPELM
jgi:hypothetical protein